MSSLGQQILIAMPFDKAVVLNQDAYVCYTIFGLEKKKTPPIFFLVQTRKSEGWERSWLVRVHRIWFLNFLCMIRPVPLWIVADSLGVVYDMFMFCFPWRLSIRLWKTFQRKAKIIFSFPKQLALFPNTVSAEVMPQFPFLFWKTQNEKKTPGPLFQLGPYRWVKHVLRIPFSIL